MIRKTYNICKSILHNIRGAVGYSLLILNTIIIAIFFSPLAFIKKRVVNKNIQKKFMYLMHKLGELWISINYYIVKIFAGVKLNIECTNDIKNIKNLSHSWNLVIANHQSWIDVFILQFVFNKKIPFQKYLVKEQLRKIPIMGYVWESIDCPFLKRTSDKTSFDLNSIKQSCDKIMLLPSTIVSFVEGTRFNKKIHNDQNSPYKNLLIPKGGGIACLLEQMNGHLDYIIDTTIAYNPRGITFWDMFCGKLNHIDIKINIIDIPDWLIEKHSKNIDYTEYKSELNNWLNNIWSDKDKYLSNYY